MSSYEKYLKYKLKYLNLKQNAGSRSPSINASILLSFLHDNQYKVVFVIERNRELSLPGGGINPGETHKNAMLREFKEEVGMDLPPLLFDDNFIKYTNPENSNITYIYISPLKNSRDKVTFKGSLNNETIGTVNLSFNTLVDELLLDPELKRDILFTDTKNRKHRIRRPIKKSLLYLLYKGYLDNYINDLSILTKLKIARKSTHHDTDYPHNDSSSGSGSGAGAGAGAGASGRAPARDIRSEICGNILRLESKNILSEPLLIKLIRSSSGRSRCLDKNSILFKIIANSIGRLIKDTRYENLTFRSGLHVELYDTRGNLKIPGINLENNSYCINKFKVVLSTSRNAIGLLLTEIPWGKMYKDTYHITILFNSSGFNETDRSNVERVLLYEFNNYIRIINNGQTYNLNRDSRYYLNKVGSFCRD